MNESKERAPRHVLRTDTAGYLVGTAVTAAAASLGQAFFGGDQLADLVMVFLLGVVLVSLRWGLGPSLFTAVASVLTLDLLFIPPYGTLAVRDVRHIVTLAVMLLCAAVISGLTKRVRDQGEAAAARERRTAALYSLSRALSGTRTREETISVGMSHIHEVFGGRVTALVPDARAQLVPRVASYALDPQERMHLDAFVLQIEAALDRARLGAQAKQAELEVEAERLRSSLLSSVSHDLRTPLAVITGMATTLADERLAPAVRRDLTETIVQEAARLNALVRNLLDMTRVEAGALRVHKEWQPIEEVVGAALASVEHVLGARPVATDVPRELSAPFDAVLIQQVLVNLLENAAKYTAPDAAITVAARPSGESGKPQGVELTVSDAGEGVPLEERERIFEKFHRAEKGKGGGVGLGLTLCRAIVVAHGGHIWVDRGPAGGASFHLTLPLDGEPPALADSAPAPEDGHGPS